MIIDAAPFISLEQNPRRFLTLVDTAIERDVALFTNHGVLGQVIRQPARQALLFQLLARDCIEVLPIDNATAIGLALAETGTADIVDASLAVMSRVLNRPVLTADVDDLSKFGVAVERF